MITRPNVDFPEPDSPTIPSASPLYILRETTSTAFKWPTVLLKIQPLIGKYFLILFIFNRTSCSRELLYECLSLLFSSIFMVILLHLHKGNNVQHVLDLVLLSEDSFVDTDP